MYTVNHTATVHQEDLPMKSIIASHNQFAFTYYYFMTSKGIG